MRKLLLLFMMQCCMLFVAAQEATDVLDAAIKKIKSDVGIRMNIEMTIYDVDGGVMYTDEGSLLVGNSVATKKERYVLLLENMKIWCNGTTQWNYMAQTNEIYITEADSEEAQTFSPVYLMQLYKQNYDCSLRKEGGYNVVTLMSNNEDNEYKKIDIYINGHNSLLDKIELSMGQGGSTKIAITDYKSKCKFEKSQFVCPVKEFPDAEIVDMLP